MIIETVVEKKDAKGRDHSKWSVNGVGEYGKQEIVIKTVEFVLPQLLKSNSLADAVAQFNEKAQCTKNPLVCDAQPKLKKYDEIVVSDGTSNYTVYAMNWLESDEALVFIDKVNTAFSNIPTSAAPAKPAKPATPKPAAETKPAKPAESKPAKPAQSGPTINLETLISAALADGVVTDKERAVLVKKVKDAGGDVDEFELLLDARIFEAQKATKETKPKPEKKTKSNDPFEGLMVKVDGGVFEQKGTYSYEYQPSDHRKKSEWRTGTYSRQVKVSDFQICKYQVTQKQWKDIMGEFPEKQDWEGDDLPVIRVSWEDAQKFIEKLNQLTGKSYHLPSQAQWEFAARGGNKTHNYKYAGSDNVDEVAHYKENSWNRIQPVGQKKANELGLFDMSGNVWEWCFDWYTEYLGNTNIQDPTGPTSGSYRVYRGGGWYNDASYCEVSYRARYTPSYRNNYLGFRLVL